MICQCIDVLYIFSHHIFLDRFRFKSILLALFLTQKLLRMTECLMNMKLLWISTVLLLSALMINGQTTPEELTYMTESYPPHNYKENGKLKGASVEVLEAMWKEMGSSLTAKDIKLMPWARAYSEVQKTPKTVLFGMGESDERKKFLKFVGSYNATKVCIIAHKSFNTSFSKVKDLEKSFKIGVIRKDIGEALMSEKEKVSANRLDKSVDVKSMMKKLQVGRLQLVCTTEKNAYGAMKSLGMNKNDYKVVNVVKTLYSSYGFHKDTPDALIQKFQKALDACKRKGIVDKILKKYDLM